MPEKQVLKRARKARKEGKAASTPAGEFVREEIEHVREGKHGARSTRQAIAISLPKEGGIHQGRCWLQGRGNASRTCTQAQQLS